MCLCSLGAYESQGLFKQALTDIQQVNRSDATSPETKEIEKRLKDIVSGRRPPSWELLFNLGHSLVCRFTCSEPGIACTATGVLHSQVHLWRRNQVRWQHTSTYENKPIDANSCLMELSLIKRFECWSLFFVFFNVELWTSAGCSGAIV